MQAKVLYGLKAIIIIIIINPNSPDKKLNFGNMKDGKKGMLSNNLDFSLS